MKYILEHMFYVVSRVVREKEYDMQDCSVVLYFF